MPDAPGQDGLHDARPDGLDDASPDGLNDAGPDGLFEAGVDSSGSADQGGAGLDKGTGPDSTSGLDSAGAPDRTSGPTKDTGGSAGKDASITAPGGGEGCECDVGTRGSDGPASLLLLLALLGVLRSRIQKKNGVNRG